MIDRAQEIIERGDPLEIIRVGLRARRKAEEGVFCECEAPILAAYDLMCGRCLLENQGQIERRTARIRSLHTFEPSGEGQIKREMCRICSGWKDDPRHSEQQGEVG